MKKKAVLAVYTLVLMLSFMCGVEFSFLYPYQIYGRVKKNGVPQSGIDVRVRNDATGDYDTVTTNAYGEYLVNVANFEHGYSDGDNITVTLLIDPIVEKSTYIDLTNHPDGREVLFFIYYDVTPPEIIIISPENGTYLGDSVSLEFTVNETVSWIGYSLDNQANVTVTGNTTLTGLAIGPHNVVVYANDTYGNTGSSDKVYFTITEPSPPVGGIWIPVNKVELLAPYIGLVILLAVSVVTVAYVKKRKKSQ